ncbi:MAG: hypothetical protein ACYCSN_06080 [Acidobacteriaceae bacterium]
MLRKQVVSGKVVPLIGDGRYPQYLVHENDLGQAVLIAAEATMNIGRALIVAHLRPLPFRDLISGIAAQQGKSITLVPMPWRLIYGFLKAAEAAGAKPALSSDSVLSLVHQDPRSDFTLEAGLALSVFAAIFISRERRGVILLDCVHPIDGVRGDD